MFLLSLSILLLSKILLESLYLSEYEYEQSSKRLCPVCGSEHLIKNGSIHNGKSKHQCKNCGHQFVDNPNNIFVPQATKQLIDKLLLERISLRGIARVTQVSWSWLQNYVNHKFAYIPRKIILSGKSRGKLVIECDEMWSFVDSKKNQFYIWLAIDRNTREIVGCFVGDRTKKSARKLWASLPDIYQESAFAYTDFWQAYQAVIPHKRHRAVGKETGLRTGCGFFLGVNLSGSLYLAGLSTI